MIDWEEVFVRLEYFEYLVALSQNRSMSAASRELHVAPQTLSIAIRKLEQELGVKLVVTDNQGTMLNETGLFLVEKAKEFFDAIAVLRQHGLELAAISEPAMVRVLADEWIKEDFAAELLSGIGRDGLSLDVTMNYCKESELPAVFSESNYDVGLLYNIIVNDKAMYAIDPGLSFVPFWRSDLYCIMHRAHPLADRKTVSLQMLSQTEGPLVVDPFGEEFLAVFKQFAPLPPLDWEDNLIALQKKVRSNLGFSMDYLSFDGMPVRGLPPDCVAVRVSDSLYGLLGYLLKTNTLPSRATRLFLDYLLSDIAHIA